METAVNLNAQHAKTDSCVLLSVHYMNGRLDNGIGLDGVDANAVFSAIHLHKRI